MRARRWELALATIGALAIVAFLAVALLTALPPALANLASVTVEDAAGESFAVGADAEVVVPEGWIVQLTDSAVTVRTPDAVMRAVIQTAPDPPDRALERVTIPGVEGIELGAAQSEVLASGLLAVHADAGQSVGDAEALSGVVAAVAATEEGPSVTVAAWSSTDMARYRPALAELLEGIRFR